MKIVLVICFGALLSACEVVMILAGPRPVSVQPIMGLIGVKLDGRKVISMDLPSGQWETRVNSLFDFSSANFPEQRQAVGMAGQREPRSQLSRTITISANPYESSERDRKYNQEIINSNESFQGTPKELYTKFFAPESDDLIAFYYRNYNTLAFQRFSVSGFRCVKILSVTLSSQPSYYSKIGCPGRYKGKDVFIWFELSINSEENLGAGVDASKQRFEEYAPEFERVVKAAIFSKDFTQTAPKISQSTK